MLMSVFWHHHCDLKGSRMQFRRRRHNECLNTRVRGRRKRWKQLAHSPASWHSDAACKVPISSLGRFHLCSVWRLQIPSMEPGDGGSSRQQGRKRTRSASPEPLNLIRRRNRDGTIDWRWLEENEPAPGDRSSGTNPGEIVDLEAPSTSHGQGSLWREPSPPPKEPAQLPVGVATRFFPPWSLIDRFTPALKGISAGSSTWHRRSGVNRESTAPTPNVSSPQATAQWEETQEDQPGPSNVSRRYH
ncbi:uncharacterized protein LOC142570355 isoform X2 [Dermacentor variabilis]|uniref:uncharacterized protein LOC142570355 isoform X2 n=1 Tax=Dermacentor variabilis TaxID=34621 RepID=UPI003F5B2410